MKSKNRFSGLEPKIYNILDKSPESRNSDTTLWLMYVESVNKGLTKLPTAELMLNLKNYGLSSIEAVGRCRRKLQEKYPDLRGSEYVVDMKYEVWKEAREYART